MAAVRKGNPEDIPEIVEIYGRIFSQEEQGKASTGWIRNVYPSEGSAREALEAGELFVMVEGTAVAAAARINRVQVSAYAAVPWMYREAKPEQVMVIHTLVVDPLRAGRGYGTAFIDFYERYALKNRCPYLRMDTNERNLAARRLYGHLGYREAGIVPCEFNGISGVRLVCLEKKLDGRG